MEVVNSMAQINKYCVTWQDIKERLSVLDKSLKYYGVPRGGQYLSAMLNPVDTPEEADIIIDDLIDSGATEKKYKSLYNKPFVALFDKRKEYNNIWLEMPWERSNDETIENNIARILQYFNYNVNTDSLKETPKRYIKAMTEILIAPEPKITIFDSQGYSQMICDKNIPYYSLCEHHILPFFGNVKIGYIPDKHIIGLSKLARIVEYFSRRLNTQEYFTDNIANYLEDKLQPLGIGVFVTGRHLCKEMRGVKKQGEMITTALRGRFFEHKVREEFLNY